MPVVVIGGVTAVGKTSIAKKLEDVYQWDYIEADEFHSPANVQKMSSGVALTDADRLPWLQRLHEKLKYYASHNQSCVMTCSALKKIYRRILLTGSVDVEGPVPLPAEGVYLIMLTLSKETLHQRLLKRQHEHFMSPALLESQLETLELPSKKTDEPYLSIIECDGLSPEQIIQQIQVIIKQ